MSTTVAMPNEIDSAIKSMCGEAIRQAVSALAEKYEFDADDASRFLNIDDLKIVKSSNKVTDKPNASKKTKKDATSSDEDKPKTKRGPTGYLLFTKDQRPAVTAELKANLGEGEKLQSKDTITELATRWKSLSDDAKSVWNAKAKATTVESIDAE